MNFKKNFKRFFTLSRNAEGFTLVELIVVIAILGILATITIPTYGNYVEASQKKTEEYNLAILNNLWNVSCTMNDADPALCSIVDIDYVDGVFSGLVEVNAPSLSAPESGEGTSTESGTAGKGAAIVGTFNEYFGDQTMTFKHLVETEDDLIAAIKEGVETSGGTGVKVNVTLTDSKGNQFTLEIPVEDVEKFEASTLYQKLGAAGLTAKVDFVTDFATGLMGDPTSTLTTYIMSDTQKLALAKAFGYDSYEEFSTDESENSPYASIFASVGMELLNDPKNAALAESDPDAFNLKVEQQIMADYAVVTSAQTAKNISADNFLTVLKNQDAKGMIKDGDSAAVMTKAALAYAMYTSYANSSYAQGTVDTSNPDAIMDNLNDPNFQAYLNDPVAKSDLEGYLSALSMSSTVIQGSQQTLQDVLTNGYSNNNVNTMIGQIMGSTAAGE